MNKIIIRVRGGVVTDVYANTNNYDVEILDEDTVQNCDADDEESIKDNHARLEAEAALMIAVY